MVEDIKTILTENPGLTNEEIVEKLRSDFKIYSERMISTDMVIFYLAKHKSLKTLKESDDELAQGFWLSLNNNIKEFNIMNSSINIGLENQKMLNALVYLNIVTEEFRDACINYANMQIPKYKNVTAWDVKIARSPAIWKDVNIVSGNPQIVLPEGNQLVNSSNSGMFRFTLTPSESFKGNVSIRMYAKTSDQTNFALQSSFPINITNAKWEEGSQVAHTFKRPPGLSGYRHFKFEYKGPFNGSFSAVEVEGVN